MKRFSEQFKKQSESIHLRASERKALRERVLSYMEYHPMPTEAALRTAKPAGKISVPFAVFKLNSLYVRSFAGVFAVFIIVGIPFVAERSMPGDMLYPVKVEFNEELRSSLSLSPYAKVAWETERLERRIAEARLLASEGKLTEEAETKVAQAVKEHSDAAQREIAQLRQSDSDEAAMAGIALASALDVQTEVLENHIEKEVGSQAKDTGRSVLALAQVVAQARETVESAQTEVRPSYERLLGRVEFESTSIYELFASVRKDASEEEMVNVERRLQDIERKIAQATKLKEGSHANTDVLSTTMMSTEGDDATSTEANVQEEAVASTTQASDVQGENDAVEILRSALTDIQKLRNYMTHIDVRNNVSIEELVPLILTEEEKIEQSRTILDETIALQAKIGLRELNGELLEKVSLGQQDIEIKLAAAVELMETGHYEEALDVLEKAKQLAVDLNELTKDQPLKQVPVLPQTAKSATSTE